ncbi:MAG: ATP-binding cassette domain-containing protein [Puniceicoccales bacterium]|jgi:polar amino acid transport system ATP-binding protein|nr:ATP-binding cassette domain-containing protein [Puniceicoccales bacterium]
MLKIREVCKAFNNINVLKNISFDVEKSDILGCAGPSGCGKSTLLRCIQKLEIIDQGTIESNGRVCFMFQDFQLFPHMTVFQNLTYAPTLKNKNKKEDYQKQAVKILEDLGIESKANIYPGALSGGQKQRVALARSLMTNPDILLCDEPTSGLDVSTTMDVVSLLKSINEQFGVTMVIASHDLDFLTKISDRIILLKNGTITIDINAQEWNDPVNFLKAYY